MASRRWQPTTRLPTRPVAPQKESWKAILPHHIAVVYNYTVVPCAMAGDGCKWQSRSTGTHRLFECLVEKV
jgi:hypothetical protein